MLDTYGLTFACRRAPSVGNQRYDKRKSCTVRLLGNIRIDERLHTAEVQNNDWLRIYAQGSVMARAAGSNINTNQDTINL